MNSRYLRIIIYSYFVFQLMHIKYLIQRFEFVLLSTRYLCILKDSVTLERLSTPEQRQAQKRRANIGIQEYFWHPCWESFFSIIKFKFLGNRYTVI